MKFSLKNSCLAIALSAVSATTALADNIVFGSYLPSAHPIPTALGEYFERLQAAGADVSVDFQSGGALVSAKGTLSSIADGIVDGATLVDIYTPAELAPSTVLSGLALLGEDNRVMAAAMSETVLKNCPQCAASEEAAGVKTVAIGSIPPYKLLCSTPVTSLDDLKGKRVRASGAWSAWIEAAGAVPVNISSAEIFEGLQRGQIECTVGAVSWLNSYSLIDVVTDVTDMPMGTFHGSYLLVFNSDTWDGYDDATRAAIEGEAPFLIRRMTELYNAEEEAAKTAADEKGITFHAPADDLVERFATYKQDELTRVVAMGEERGVSDTATLVEAFTTSIAKWQDIVGQAQDDPAAFEDALNREIYAVD